jgi:hypothetical protein
MFRTRNDRFTWERYLCAVPSFVLRVWVPDRPGALGAVASRIGAVRGDLVGIDILERGGGRAIDELVVELPRVDLVDLLVAEVSEVDGVDVEDVREAPEASVDPRLDALETAASLVAHAEVGSLLDALARRSLSDFQSDWAAIVDLDSFGSVVTVGAAPPASWLGAFVTGSRASMDPGPEGGPDDVAWADVDAAGLVIVLGRKGRPFRARERRQLTALARIVDHRWIELHTRAGRLAHPSAMDLVGAPPSCSPTGRLDPAGSRPLAARAKTGSPVHGVDDPHVGD